MVFLVSCCALCIRNVSYVIFHYALRRNLDGRHWPTYLILLISSDFLNLHHYLYLFFNRQTSSPSVPLNSFQKLSSQLGSSIVSKVASSSPLHSAGACKVVQDNILYAKAVKLMGDRTYAAKHDLSKILPEEVETELKEA